jgi:hypothetical protein
VSHLSVQTLTTWQVNCRLLVLLHWPYSTKVTRKSLYDNPAVPAPFKYKVTTIVPQNQSPFTILHYRF